MGLLDRWRGRRHWREQVRGAPEWYWKPQPGESNHLLDSGYRDFEHHQFIGGRYLDQARAADELMVMPPLPEMPGWKNVGTAVPGQVVIEAEADAEDDGDWLDSLLTDRLAQVAAPTKAGEIRASIRPEGKFDGRFFSGGATAKVSSSDMAGGSWSSRAESPLDRLDLEVEDVCALARGFSRGGIINSLQYGEAGAGKTTLLRGPGKVMVNSESINITDSLAECIRKAGDSLK